mmetsp:Transcript_64664/g.140819  ORF Transcript_64664/g.140819 Transcript_64664/m.140819 type:complete len:298 (-) Transcript_64664:93-986(-)
MSIWYCRNVCDRGSPSMAREPYTERSTGMSSNISRLHIEVASRNCCENSAWMYTPLLERLMSAISFAYLLGVGSSMTSQPLRRAQIVSRFSTELFPVPLWPSMRKPSFRMRGRPLASVASFSSESCKMSSTVRRRSISPTGRVADGTRTRSRASSPQPPSGRLSMMSSRFRRTNRPTSSMPTLFCSASSSQRLGLFTGNGTRPCWRSMSSSWGVCSLGGISSVGGHSSRTSSGVTASSRITLSSSACSGESASSATRYGTAPSSGCAGRSHFPFLGVALEEALEAVLALEAAAGEAA